MSYRIEEGKAFLEFEDINLENILRDDIRQSEVWLYHEKLLNNNLSISDIDYISRNRKVLKELIESYEDIILRLEINRIQWIREELDSDSNLTPKFRDKLERSLNYHICSITNGLDFYSKSVIGKKNLVSEYIDKYFIDYDKSIREGK